jgi:PglZ domain.
LKNWRNEILKHFSEPIPALTIVADPDELLCDESIMQSLNEKGIELVEYQEPVSFRYLYENIYRDALAKASRCLAVRTKLTTFEQIPYDLLAQSVQLRLSVGVLFPGFSLNILSILDKADYERLYEVYDQYRGSGSDSEAMEFLLKYLYDIYVDAVNSKSALFKVLLSIHYANRRIPETIAVYLSSKWSKLAAIKDLPLKELICASGVFYNFLQNEWNEFIQKLAFKEQVIKEIGTKDIVLDVPSPFADGDIRSMVDNLFVEGKLRPVKIGSRSLPKWVAFGIESDTFGQARIRLLEQIYHLSEKLDTKLTHKDWLKHTLLYGEIIRKGLLLSNEKENDLALALKQLQMQVDRLFHAWILLNYQNLSNLPYLPLPVMTHHIPHFLASKLNGSRMALLVLDGMSVVQWAQIREALASLFDFEQNAVYSWLPTVTSIARQSIFAGEMPVYYSQSLGTTAKEEAHWQRFWANRGIGKIYVDYLRIVEYPGDYTKFQRLLPKNKVRAIVVDLIDQLVHSALQGQRGLYEELKIWLDSGFLQDMITSLVNEGYQVYITSDHGNRECTGTGKISEGVLAYTKGERARVYHSQVLRDQAASRYGGTPWNSSGLPQDMHVLLAPESGAYVTKGEQLISHGSMSAEEVIVPFIKVWPKGRKEH